MPEVKLKVTVERAKELILLGIVDVNKVDLRSMRDAPAHFDLYSDGRYMEWEEARRR